MTKQPVSTTSILDQIAGAIAKADGASIEVILDLDTTDDGWACAIKHHRV